MARSKLNIDNDSDILDIESLGNTYTNILKPIQDNAKHNFNFKLFEDLCGILCSLDEILLIMRVSRNKLNKMCMSRYGLNLIDARKRYSANGLMSLRRAQLRLAQRYPVAAIWLGKQWLGQRDLPLEDHASKQAFDAFSAAVQALAVEYEHQRKSQDAVTGESSGVVVPFTGTSP